MKRVFIIGAGGQDGTYLEAKLSGEGNEIINWFSSGVRTNFGKKCYNVSIENYNDVKSMIRAFSPDEIYYLAGVHHSSEEAHPPDLELLEISFSIHVRSLGFFLESMRKYNPNCRIFYASSSHIFGKPAEVPQSESTPFRPESIYGLTKMAGMNLCSYFRDRHGLYASCGILYNHDSPLRKSTFLSKKVVDTARRIKNGEKIRLNLGRLDGITDWGWAPDYVEAMTKVLELPVSDDFIIASGKGHKTEDFVSVVFQKFGLDWRDHTDVDLGKLTRQVPELVGNPEKIFRMTGWKSSQTLHSLIDNLIK